MAESFDVSKSAADRIVDSLARLLALEAQCLRCSRYSAALDDALVPASGNRAARRPGELPYAPRRRLKIDTRTRLVMAAGTGPPEDHTRCAATAASSGHIRPAEHVA
ncbi:hypothetical protein [Streptomyces sp. NPDC020681]|uniref:hypothetical protein n=1 Tax=Streptomyces sp. NPDC020681 TaxID=3365083 RepID=UPI0037A60BE1